LASLFGDEKIFWKKFPMWEAQASTQAKLDFVVKIDCELFKKILSFPARNTCPEAGLVSLIMAFHSYSK